MRKANVFAASLAAECNGAQIRRFWLAGGSRLRSLSVLVWL
jgi:hypothetical protein